MLKGLISAIYARNYPENFIDIPTKNYLWRFMLLILVACTYFALILKSNYSPINDAWLQFISVDHGKHSWDIYWRRIKNLDFGDRFFRGIPYLITTYTNGEGFYTSKIFLFALNVLTGTGIYLLINSLFPNRRMFAVIFALSYFLFSFDGTMFWLGAFGVNISLCATVYSIYVFHRALLLNSYKRLLLACVLLIISYMSYVGSIVFIPILIGLLALLWFKNWKSRTIYFLTYAAAFLIGNLPMFTQYLDNAGRVANVSSFSHKSVMANFSDVFAHYTTDVPASLITPNLEFIIPAIVFAILTFFLLLSISKKGADEESYKEKRFSNFDLFLAITVGLILIIAGYLPYAFSNLAMEGERSLLYSRSGFILIFLVGLTYIIGRIIPNNETYRKTIAVVGAVLVMMFFQDKAQRAQAYHDDSQKVRQFLSELVKIAPDYKEGSEFLFYVEPKIFTGKKATMVVNRPKFLLRYLYQDYDLNAVTTSAFWLGRSGIQQDEETIQIRGVTLQRDKIIALHYDLENGFTPATEFIWNENKDGKKTQMTIQLPGTTNVIEKPLSERQIWFKNEGH